MNDMNQSFLAVLFSKPNLWFIPDRLVWAICFVCVKHTPWSSFTWAIHLFSAFSPKHHCGPSTLFATIRLLNILDGVPNFQQAASKPTVLFFTASIASSKVFLGPLSHLHNPLVNTWHHLNNNNKPQNY